MMLDAENSEPPSAPRPTAVVVRSDFPRVSVPVLDPQNLLPTPDRVYFLDRLSAALSLLGLTGEVRIRLVDDPEMTRLHDQHCGDPTTTDVLTFNLSGEPPVQPPPASMGEWLSADHLQATTPRSIPQLDVDLIICVAQASREAARRGHSLGNEVLLYALHGVLHCLGYDDHEDADFAVMHALEDEILRAIGAGTIYAADATVGASSAFANGGVS